jgi:tRNA nucleotidyltransferase (CCA-adding enzyme)
LGKIATIEARPDQSKHLETATTTFLGLDLDFVQLRSEEYGDQDSRIPSSVVSLFFAYLFLFFPLCLLARSTDHWLSCQRFLSTGTEHQRFGTPLEDALRRDITINSLFYNVHTGAIEDHTGKVRANTFELIQKPNTLRVEYHHHIS